MLTLKKALEVMQSLLNDRRILTGNNCSDGVLAMRLREMLFAGNCGIEIDKLVECGGSSGEGEIHALQRGGWVSPGSDGG